MALTIEEILEKSKQDAHVGVTFEEAMKSTKFGKFHYFLIFVSGCFMGSVFFETMAINYVLPVSECDLNITTKSQYGLVSGVWFAGIILTSHLWGFLSDTYGRRKILIIASLSAFIASVLSSLSVNIYQMTFFRLLNGMCISGSSSAIFAYLGEFLGEKNRSRSMMVSSVVFAMFCISMPILAWLIINQTWSFVLPLIRVIYKPWRLFLLCCGAPSLLCGILMTFFPESPKFTFSEGEEEKTIEIFKKIYRYNTGSRDYPVYKIKPNEEFEDSREKKNVARMMLNQTLSLVREYPRAISIVSLLQFGIYFVCNGMLIFFPDILNQTAKYLENSADESVKLCKIVESAIESGKLKQSSGHDTCSETLDISAYYYAILLEACYVVGFILVSLLVNYIGRLTIFSIVFFSTGLCGFLIVFISNPLVSTYLYVWLLVCGVNNTLMNTVTYDLFPTNLRSLAMSLSLMFGRFGALIGGNAAGFLLESHCESTFVLSGFVLILSGILTFFIPNILKRK